jgi:NADH-quinone oxidoreductase subunit A
VEPDWLPIFTLTLLVVLAVGIPVGMMSLSWMLNRHKSNNPSKDEPYECGLTETVGTASERFSVKFYLIAMLFLVFDLEVAFLYPWAVHFLDGGWEMVWILVVFLVILEAGYLYLYRKGALDWDK